MKNFDFFFQNSNFWIISLSIKSFSSRVTAAIERWFRAVTRVTRVARFQSFRIHQILHFSCSMSYCHLKTAPPMNTFNFSRFSALTNYNFAAP